LTRLIFPENIEKPEKRKKRKKSGKPLEKGCIPEKRYSPSITSIIRGKYENRPEGAKRPTAGSEAREFTSRAERGRVSPLFQDTSPRWRRHPKDENVSLRAKRSNLFDRDCFVACAPRNDTPSSLMRCHCCSFDRLLGHRDNAYFSRNRLSDRGKQHFPFCYRSSEVALLAQRFLETSKVRLCGKPLAKRKPEGQVRIFPKNLFFDRDCFVACAPRNDTPSSLMRCHCCSFDRLPLFWNAPLEKLR